LYRKSVSNEIVLREIRERDLVVLSDEIYSRIWYEQRPASIASLPGMLDKTIILDGFSKTYAMTGWRIGYGVFPPHLVDAINKLMVNSNSCTASFTQRAAIAALRGDQTPAQAMVENSASGGTRSCKKSTKYRDSVVLSPQAPSTRLSTSREQAGHQRLSRTHCSRRPG
jgi:aspartate/methionine/tyrosine aminotransferase